VSALRAVALNFSVAFVPEPEATLVGEAQDQDQGRNRERMGVRLCADDRTLPFNKSVSSPQ